MGWGADEVGGRSGSFEGTAGVESDSPLALPLHVGLPCNWCRLWLAYASLLCTWQSSPWSERSRLSLSFVLLNAYGACKEFDCAVGLSLRFLFAGDLADSEHSCVTADSSRLETGSVFTCTGGS